VGVLPGHSPERRWHRRVHSTATILQVLSSCIRP
jgi:hypothetical protein